MDAGCLFYREVLPDTSCQEEWTEIQLNTGATQSTLQDIKVAEKAGGYCFQNVRLNHNRNRFIYWRTYQDVLELSEVCLDFTLYKNNVRYKFSDTPVLNVCISEQDGYVTLLVTTVCSLHHLKFPHPDTLAEGSGNKIGAQNGSSNLSSKNGGISIDFNESQTFSIFHEANNSSVRDPSSFYVIDSQNAASSPAPHAATSFLSPSGGDAYFALACQSELMLFVMNCETGDTTSQSLKENNIMPRLFSNLKNAFTGKNDFSDANYANSVVFSYINGQIYLLALYRDDQLRVWSTTNFQCACSIDCVRDNNRTRIQGPQSSALRKISNTSFCAFLSHATRSEFVCINIHPETGTSSGLSISYRKSIPAPALDLADFAVCENRIWALWTNAEGEFSISNYPLLRGLGMNWSSVALEPPPDRYCVVNEHGMDPREAYCNYIFQRGIFEREVIAKALFMFRRTNLRFESKHCTLPILKDQVCQAVEDEIQNEVKEFDVTDEDYLEIATRQWERFYSCCEQYHLKSCQPCGFFLLEPIDGLCVVKKNTFSLLRPCETLEHFMLVSDDLDVNTAVSTYFAGNERVGEDLVILVSIVAQLERWLPDETKGEIDKRLYRLEMPNVFIAKLSDEILAGDPDRELFPSTFLVWIRQKIQSINDMGMAMTLLLESLRMDNGNPAGMQTNLGIVQSSQYLSTVGVLFGSHLGLSVLSETVRQITAIKFSICRNLLIMQQILIDTYSLGVDLLEKMRSHFMPDTTIFLQSYFVMGWIAETPVNIAAAASLESSIQRLNLLQLTNGSGRIYSNGGKYHVSPLVRVFLNAKGLYASMALYADNFKNSENIPTLSNTLLPLTTIVSQLIWPVSFNFVFGEWLFGTCQHIVIQNYVRLLSNWCEWNICSRQFILAVSLLDSGESFKAYDLFLQSAKGVLREQFLTDKILKGTPLAQRAEYLSTIGENDGGDALDTNVNNQVITQYYLKVIQLLEQHNALDHIISMAQVAIGLLGKSDSQLPMFQSIVFNNHLQLEHYEEAYHSLIYNAELSRRKDCLRQLVVTLFNRKRLDLLMHFPYVGLHEEFENIVESRARSLVIDQNEVYDFLYAFHVNNGNMRKASAIMYEQAMRFQLEGDSIESMEKRCASLLVCINSLHLIDRRYRWIAKPVIGLDDAQPLSALNDSEPMDTKPDDDAIREQVVVLEIKDIKRELLHTEALMRLADHRKDIQTFIHAGPQELAIILSGCGLYTAALKLVNGFEISTLSIFESLTAACVRVSEESANEAWAWLQENDLADLPHRNKAADMAWSFLQKLIYDNELENATRIRKSVVNKLLSLNAFVPQWLYNEYKMANCTELLYLFVKHNRLIEAAELAQEMISAMLGAGSEYFSFKHAIAVTNQEMCLPVNTLDLLLHGLRLNADSDIEYKQVLSDLEDIIQIYIDTAQRTADDKIQMAFQEQRSHQRQQVFMA
ncbi:PREDICTED: nuclear pore complex protein Nup160 homolog isoform X3 [Rhagoletis zephyria]|uniref:nuclear pore complex protein Nup160 homolog isoform X1 n=1 Tax=Rhagoletis zephyria TaxID=28612 RepID=UPI0008117012|nr:PREDICTED: nuclear pore complex protein Nup160 homolog isoform X1 [Rhagoletis zephyria]XP_017480293.1 PREDICTED: nuclear pore complex protein Nup160 homolog isoform X2 [Rhagoletis zephyria]XP_017480294.1 PREDICTED: nuclear pore complex protein Nup160 homolog isoform X3 [Rhagoletis zephyria]